MRAPGARDVTRSAGRRERRPDGNLAGRAPKDAPAQGRAGGRQPPPTFHGSAVGTPRRRGTRLSSWAERTSPRGLEMSALSWDPGLTTSPVVGWRLGEKITWSQLTSCSLPRHPTRALLSFTLAGAACTTQGTSSTLVYCCITSPASSFCLFLRQGLVSPDCPVTPRHPPASPSRVKLCVTAPGIPVECPL